MATSLGVNGLIYPASQGADSDANVMDDYEEGTWTPTYEGTSGTAGSQASSEAVGHYVKIGRLVSANFKYTLTNKGSWSASVRFQGLPYNKKNDTEQVSAGSINVHNVNYDASMICSYVLPVSVRWYLFMAKANAASVTLGCSVVAADAAFRGTINYWTA